MWWLKLKGEVFLYNLHKRKMQLVLLFEDHKDNGARKTTPICMHKVHRGNFVENGDSISVFFPFKFSIFVTNVNEIIIL